MKNWVEGPRDRWGQVAVIEEGDQPPGEAWICRGKSWLFILSKIPKVLIPRFTCLVGYFQHCFPQSNFHLLVELVIPGNSVVSKSYSRNWGLPFGRRIWFDECGPVAWCSSQVSLRLAPEYLQHWEGNRQSLPQGFIKYQLLAQDYAEGFEEK